MSQFGVLAADDAADACQDAFSACIEALVGVNGNGGWTCTEAEMMARAIAAVGLVDMAESFMLSHAEADEEGDAHEVTAWDPDYPQIPTAWGYRINEEEDE